MGLRANASSPMTLEECEVPARPPAHRGRRRASRRCSTSCCRCSIWAGAAVALGICRAAVAATVAHLKTAGSSISAHLARREPAHAARAAGDDADRHRRPRGADRRVRDTSRSPATLTMLRRARGEGRGRRDRDRRHLAARCAPAAARPSRRHTSIERFFRDAHAGAVMAPTVDVLREFIGKALLGMPLF